MGLTTEQIQTILKKYPGAKRIAVENFLLSKQGDVMADSINMQMDAQMYKWNRDTINAIREGISIPNVR
jgi:hypothetical protein